MAAATVSECGGRGVAERLAGGLRQVARRAVGLPESERQRALEFYLAYQLEGEPRSGVPALLRETLAQFDPGGGVLRAGREERAPAVVTAEGKPASPGDESAKALAALAGKLRPLAGGDADPALSPEALLERALARAEAVERSVRQTAQEFFDRLLEALDPDAARAFVGKPGLRPAPLYKAAVFDAYAEKFSQLAEYHRKGRLVRDFRASFKRNLRK